MQLFDFMSDEDLKASLEADYQELELCMIAGAWKAIHVLAGSIIEAVLLDYLLATDYPKRSSTKLSDMTLFGIINVCKQEGILTTKSAALSQVIREYRNFIHPEKLRRLGETADKKGAVVAQALVEMVVEDIATRRKETYGYTAEQLVTKIVRDPSVTPILGHLLKSTKQFEIKRLLLKVLPEKYFFLIDPDNSPDDVTPSRTVLSNLETCFRLAFDTVSSETRQEVAKHFVRILKEESADVVAAYETVFFRAKDLVNYPSEDTKLVIHHFLSILKSGVTNPLLKAVEGIGQFLTPEEVGDCFVDPFLRAMLSNNFEISIEKAEQVLLSEFYKMSDDTQEIVSEMINDWIVKLKNKKLNNIEIVESLRFSIDLEIEIKVHQKIDNIYE